MQSNHITLIVMGLLLFGMSLVLTQPKSASQPTRTAALTLPGFIPGSKPDNTNLPEPQQQPLIEVVFVLDTTGSMGGLIDGAKQKIWSIINELKSGRPEPILRIGLVGYRDRGDAYVTRHSALSEDIDAVYTDLMSFQAGGGGDTPESVNQALHEAVTRFDWSRNPDTLRVVFLVGDAPPKSYQDDVPYTTTCALARDKDIIINTIQCGAMTETTGIWKSIAQMGHGGFAAIRQDGGMVVASTPYDDQINQLNRKISATVIPYGDHVQRDSARRKMETASALTGFAAAERQAYVSASAPSAAITGRGDLLADLANADVDLDELSEKELPEELKGLSKTEMESKIAAKVESRQALQKELTQLLEQRKAFLAKAAEETGESEDAFDVQVKDMVRTQAATKAIVY